MAQITRVIQADPDSLAAQLNVLVATESIEIITKTTSAGKFIVISDKYLGVKVVNPYAIDVFRALLMFISVLVGINAYAKKAELKTIENIVNDKETE